ncbi:hypothetical protein L7F22_068551 [Adiantum nelumboides]|nr:hypothetical protein [Adiantum nelumboides]
MLGRCKPAVLWRGRVAEGRHQVRAVHMEPAASAELASTENGAKASDSLAQYVVIRKDLVDTLKWPLGSVLAQACHAAVAAVWLHKDHPNTLQYCGNLDSMTTVMLQITFSDEKQLERVDEDEVMEPQHILLHQSKHGTKKQARQYFLKFKDRGYIGSERRDPTTQSSGQASRQWDCSQIMDRAARKFPYMSGYKTISKIRSRSIFQKTEAL